MVQARDPNEPPPEDPDEVRKRRATFLRQHGLLTGVKWNLNRRHLSGPTGEADCKAFRTWFEENYCGVEIHGDDMPKTTQRQNLLERWFGKQGREGKMENFWGGALLVIIITGIIGGLTKFQVGKPSHACWLLVWLYGGPAFRWKWLVMHSFDGEPCTSFTRWCVTEVCHALSYLIAAGVYIGMTVILVELFGAFCGGPSMTISLSVPWWIVVGGSIFALSAIIGLGISFQQEILGKSNKMMVC